MAQIDRCLRVQVAVSVNIVANRNLCLSPEVVCIDFHTEVEHMTYQGQSERDFSRLKNTGPIRCPHCVEDREFKLMLPPGAGSCYLCSNCGHRAMVGNADFICPCTKCKTLNSNHPPC